MATTVPNPRQVLAVWAESCSGPGWSNRLYWVLVKDGYDYKVEAIQPEHHTVTMIDLFRISEEVNGMLKREVNRP